MQSNIFVVFSVVLSPPIVSVPTNIIGKFLAYGIVPASLSAGLTHTQFCLNVTDFSLASFQRDPNQPVARKR